MRLGLDLRNETGDQLITKTQQADELGLWAILIGGGQAPNPTQPRNSRPSPNTSTSECGLMGIQHIPTHLPKR